MNKHFYRIIFNCSRQMLMVVADIAKSHVGMSASSRAKRDNRALSTNTILKPLVWSCALAMGSVVLSAPAAIIADGSAPGNQQPTIIAGANGTPQVDIQTPNSQGVSHNKYQNFDVDRNGVILNNSAVNIQSELGGLIAANPGLAKGEARVILNEVNGANLSHLNGFVEVAGRRADVIIANPAGITCDGCGFINANKTTVAAAQVLLEQGKIAGFDVKNGQIAITGNGMNDEKSDYTQLIARAVKINARLHAKDFTITTGKNSTDSNIISTDSVADATEDFAIDVANLGGMYANKIRLVGTEQGMGVRNAGYIGASAGNISLSADGKINNSGVMIANQNIAIINQQIIDNQGTLPADQNIQPGAKNTFMNADKGQIFAGQDIRLSAAEITSEQSTVLVAGIYNKEGSLIVRGQNDVTLQGGAMAKDSLTMIGGKLNLSGADVKAGYITLVANNTDIHTQNARLLATHHMMLVAQKNIDNQQGKIFVGAALTNTIDNTQELFAAPDNLLLISDSLNNSRGVLDTQSGLKIKTGETDNRQGRICGKTVDINTQGKRLINDADADADGQGLFAQQALMLNTGMLSNHRGKIQSEYVGLFTEKERLDNSVGEILATENLKVISGEIDNQKGLIQAQKKLTLDTQDLDLNNNHTWKTGGIISGGELAIRSGALSNQQGFIRGATSAALTTRQLNNRQGQLLSDGGLTVDVQHHCLLNEQGTLGSNGEFVLYSGYLVNTQGLMQSSAGTR